MAENKRWRERERRETVKVVEWETHRRELFNIIIKVYFRFDVDASAHDVVKVIITCRQTSLCVYLRSGRGHLIPVVFGVTIRTPLRAELLLLLLLLFRLRYTQAADKICLVRYVVAYGKEEKREERRGKRHLVLNVRERAKSHLDRFDQLSPPSSFCLLREKPKVCRKRE